MFLAEHKRRDRLAWSNYYAKRFDKTRSEQAAVLAMWYLFLHLAFDEETQ